MTNNFLLGNGETLAKSVSVTRAGGTKNAPYTFDDAKARMSTRVGAASALFQALPAAACPCDEAVAALTLHPRYLSKSDFPQDLLTTVGLRAVGSKSRVVTPERWSPTKATHEEMSAVLYVAGQRRAFAEWAERLPTWTDASIAARQIVQIEDFAAVGAGEKLKGVWPDDAMPLFEVVLHTQASFSVVEKFTDYARQIGARVDGDRIRTVGRLAFVPVRAEPEAGARLADFTFVRVVRGMPTLRPIEARVVRSAEPRLVALSDSAPAPDEIEVLVLDGGLPDGHHLSHWVSSEAPAGIGPPRAEYQDHGLAVTSAVLFGSLNPNSTASRPHARVRHVRVLDTDSGNDVALYDVLDRICGVLEGVGAGALVNLSLGPDVPADDDDVSRWTATLDAFAREQLITVAAGNSGDADPSAGLNRIQPPSDGVNVLAVGASCSAGATWARASYSSVGPGRSPGIVKPDGVAFGGSALEPFWVLSGNSPTALRRVTGTSYAAPSVLRAAAGVKSALGPRHAFSPLALRALLIHRAEGLDADPEVGWGRFDTDAARLLVSPDNEARVLFQGTLPPGVHLRVPVPLPPGTLAGKVEITATLCIAPGTDAEHSSTYTQQGVEISFRPHALKFNVDDNGKQAEHPKTKSFFSEGRLYNKPEYRLREEGKWEPCKRATASFRGTSLHEPCFDVYYHSRQDGRAVPVAGMPNLPYAMLITVRATQVADLYNQIVRAYAGILRPMTPIRPLVHVGTPA